MMLKLILSLLFVTSPALAHKDVGGGNGIGGTLMDRNAYAETTELQPQELFVLLTDHQPKIFSRYPFLRVMAMEFMTSKSWYLETRQFVSDCKNQSMVQVDSEVWACQNDIEVRINKTWWNQTDDQTKADLLFHEMFVSFWLMRDEVKSINGVVSGFLNNESDESIQRKLQIAELFALPNHEEVSRQLAAFIPYVQKISVAKSDAEASSIYENYMRSFYFQNLELAAHASNFVFCNTVNYSNWTASYEELISPLWGMYTASFALYETFKAVEMRKFYPEKFLTYSSCPRQAVQK